MAELARGSILLKEIPILDAVLAAHAAELGGRGEVDPLAHLGAAPHQGMGVDHGPVVHPGPGVHVHRGHAGDSLAQVDAVADRGAPGNDADPA